MIAEAPPSSTSAGNPPRPATQISDQEEIDRVVPVIEMVKRNFDIPVSIDGYKARWWRPR